MIGSKIHRDTTEALIGFRGFAFFLSDNDLILGSSWDSTIYLPKVDYTAKCKAKLSLRLHRAPEATCGCGFYGYYDLDSGFMLGEVKAIIMAWGKTHFHGIGFRAEHMRIIAFIENPYSLNVDKHLADKYQVPIIPSEHAMAWASEHGHVVTEKDREEWSAQQIAQAKPNFIKNAVLSLLCILLYAALTFVYPAINFLPTALAFVVQVMFLWIIMSYSINFILETSRCHSLLKKKRALSEN